MKYKKGMNPLMMIFLVVVVIVVGWGIFYFADKAGADLSVLQVEEEEIVVEGENVYENDGITLIENPSGNYYCVGCGVEVCIDPTPGTFNYAIDENPNLYCDGYLNVILNGDILEPVG